jgi:hypothetical protein
MQNLIPGLPAEEDGDLMEYIPQMLQFITPVAHAGMLLPHVPPTLALGSSATVALPQTTPATTGPGTSGPCAFINSVAAQDTPAPLQGNRSGEVAHPWTTANALVAQPSWGTIMTIGDTSDGNITGTVDNASADVLRELVSKHVYDQASRAQVRLLLSSMKVPALCTSWMQCTSELPVLFFPTSPSFASVPFSGYVFIVAFYLTLFCWILHRIQRYCNRSMC